MTRVMRLLEGTDDTTLPMQTLVQAIAYAYARGWSTIIEGARSPSDLFPITYTTTRLSVSEDEWWEARCAFLAHVRKFDAALSLVTLATPRCPS